MTHPWVLVLVGGLVSAGVIALQRRRSKPTAMAPRPGTRLAHHLDERDDYQLFVAVPAAQPDRFERLEKREGTLLTTEDGSSIDMAEVTGFVVAYPSGQVADAEFTDVPLPPSVSFLPEDGEIDGWVFDEEEVNAGRNLVRVEYSESPAHAGDPAYYRTTLTNLSDAPIRITGFSAAVVKGRSGLLKLRSSGRLYGSDEFINWYGAGPDGWLAAGASVSDPNNWGHPPIVWVYHCETKDGRRFVTGALRD